jgi:hypothetical protein
MSSSLALDLRNAATTIMTALGDIPDDVFYHSVTTGAYDVNTDTYLTTEVVLKVKGLLYKSKEKASDDKRTLLERQKVLISGQALASIVPKESDYIVIKGVKWEVKERDSAPSDAVFIFIVRQV